ncbi:hypothetical protein MC885_018980 [Smutsia gigantea]|nr:hypothetical protein MC885_018980 [Smutsia gigantea]
MSFVGDEATAARFWGPAPKGTSRPPGLQQAAQPASRTFPARRGTQGLIGFQSPSRSLSRPCAPVSYANRPAGRLTPPPQPRRLPQRKEGVAA